MVDLEQAIQENLANVMSRIKSAAITAGRIPDDVRLVVVSKGQPAQVIASAVRAGARILAENYAEEAVAKMEKLGGKLGVEWHMIGHVQSRKARLVVNNFDMVHSLDSLKLARIFNRLLEGTQKQLKVLLEFNIGSEETKSGWLAADAGTWSNLLPEIEQVIQLPHLSVCGLMTMPPLFTDPKITRSSFSKLRELQTFFKNSLPVTGWEELSMGTSTDFEEAILEGATYVRVGQAILGPRNPKAQSENPISSRQ